MHSETELPAFDWPRPQALVIAGQVDSCGTPKSENRG